MAKYDLSYELTLNSGNMATVSAAIAGLVGIVDSVRLRIDYDTEGSEAPFGPDGVFEWFKNKIGEGSVVSINVTEES